MRENSNIVRIVSGILILVFLIGAVFLFLKQPQDLSELPASLEPSQSPTTTQTVLPTPPSTPTTIAYLPLTSYGIIETEIVNHSIISPNGAYLAVDTSRSLSVYTANDLSLIWSVELLGTETIDLTWSTEGEGLYLARIERDEAGTLSSNMTISYVSTTEGAVVNSYPIPTDLGFKFSPNGTYFTAHHNGSLAVFDSANGSALFDLGIPFSSVTATNWSANEELVGVASSIPKVSVWSVATQGLISDIEQDIFIPSLLAISPDGQYVAIVTQSSLVFVPGEEAKFGIWDLTSQENVWSKEALRADGILWSPDSERILTWGDGRLQSFQLSSGETSWEKPIPSGILSFALMGDYLYGEIDGSINQIDLLTGDTTNIYLNDLSLNYEIAGISSDRLILGAKDSVEVYSLADFSVVGKKSDYFVYRGVSPVFPSLAHSAYSPDSSKIAIASLTHIEVRDTYSTAPYFQIPISGVLVWSPDSTKIAVATDNGNVQIWDVVTRELIQDYDNLKLNPTVIVWSTDTKLIVGGSVASDEGSISVIDLQTEQQTQLPTTDIPRAITASGTGNKIAYTTSNLQSPTPQSEIYVVQTDTLEIIETIPVNDRVYALEWSPTDNRVAVVGEMSTSVLDVESGDVLQDLGIQIILAPALHWSLDSSYLLVTNEQQMLLVWNVETGELVETSQQTSLTGRAVAFSNDGTFMLLAPRTGTLEFWTTNLTK